MSNKDLYLLDALWLSRNDGEGINPEEFSDRVTREVDVTNKEDDEARRDVLKLMKEGK
ncbi:MAG: hypothetical protein ACXW0T_08855 [Methylobacter sp.]